MPSEARPTAVMVRPGRNIRTPAQARAEAQARREQMVAPSPADTTTNQVFEDEDDDFKIRTEERQFQEMERALEEKKIVIAKLKEAHLVLLKEKADVKAMHDHTHDDEDQARQSRPDSNRATFENPLQE